MKKKQKKEVNSAKDLREWKTEQIWEAHPHGHSPVEVKIDSSTKGRENNPPRATLEARISSGTKELEEEMKKIKGLFAVSSG